MKGIRKTVTVLAAVCLSLAASHAMAQETCNYITFTMLDGAEVSYALKGFKITYGEGNTLVTSSDSQYTLPTAKIAKMRFTEQATAINSATADTGISVSGNIVSASGKPVTIRVFSTDGTLVMTRTLGSGHPQSADLSTMPIGIYIIKAGTQTIKLVRK